LLLSIYSILQGDENPHENGVTQDVKLNGHTADVADKKKD